jgi:hypothetical protein
MYRCRNIIFKLRSHRGAFSFNIRVEKIAKIFNKPTEE